MRILLLVFLSFPAFACEIEKEMTVEKILRRNEAIPSKSHFEKYVRVLLTKSPLRQKHCGEKLDSPACLQKLRNLGIPTLLKIQDTMKNEDLILHEYSGKGDVDEFVIKEFSNEDARFSFKGGDSHRMPLILEITKWKDHFLNIFAVECREYLKIDKNELHLGKLKLDASPEIINFLKSRPVPVFDFQKSPFEETVLHLERPELSAEYISLCLENVEKACALEGSDTNVCELKRTVRATAIYYSTRFHQLAYFEASRDEGGRNYASSGEKLMNKLILQTPQYIQEFNKCESVSAR